ncbi:hypothetical protein L3X38_016782 [Prunus dulcis]|uniref:Uncharacterized protein n=1 Tax=Prunus dulcis TaxID=3755 RepID=A0AAD4W6K9_PRUDU|nr:hypothetical protein L3X38_016782 [Prunus dulcis]
METIYYPFTQIIIKIQSFFRTSNLDCSQSTMRLKSLVVEPLALLSPTRLQHQHIVRYHMVWLEPFLVGLNNVVDDDDGGSSPANHVDLPHLYIQMELCDNILKDILENDKIMTDDMCWNIFANIMIDETTYAVNKIAIRDEQEFKFAAKKGGVDHVAATASTYRTVPYGMA